jgi:predicted nucleic acid-binding protein
VSAFVDTNVLVSHLIGDPPKMAARATAYLQRESELLVADLIVAETIYVLESFYEVARPEISEAMRALIVMESVASSTRLSCFAPWRSTNTTVLTLRRRTSSRLPNRLASCRLRHSTAQLTASKASHASSHKRLEPISLRVGSEWTLGDAIRTGTQPIPVVRS